MEKHDKKPPKTQKGFYQLVVAPGVWYVHAGSTGRRNVGAVGAGLAFRDYSPGLCQGGDATPPRHTGDNSVPERAQSLDLCTRHSWPQATVRLVGTARGSPGGLELLEQSHQPEACRVPRTRGLCLHGQARLAQQERRPRLYHVSSAHHLPPSTAWVPSPIQSFMS